MTNAVLHRCTRCNATLTEQDPLLGYHVRRITRPVNGSDLVLYTEVMNGHTTHLVACGPTRDILAEQAEKVTAPIRGLSRHLDKWEAQGDTTVSINFLRRHFDLPSPYLHVLVNRETEQSFIPDQFADDLETRSLEA